MATATLSCQGCLPEDHPNGSQIAYYNARVTGDSRPSGKELILEMGANIRMLCDSGAPNSSGTGRSFALNEAKEGASTIVDDCILHPRQNRFILEIRYVLKGATLPKPGSIEPNPFVWENMPLYYYEVINCSNQRLTRLGFFP